MAATPVGVDPLELEHVIGWTGKFPGTLLTHPKEDGTFFCALGSAVCVGDIYDPHKQRFLRGHDATVSSLAVSSSGRLVASGQLRSTLVATGDASVMVWDHVKGGAVYTFFGLTEGIHHLQFSPDERFLAAAAADNTLSVWDMSTGEQVSCPALLARSRPRFCSAHHRPSTLLHPLK